MEKMIAIEENVTKVWLQECDLATTITIGAEVAIKWRNGLITGGNVDEVEDGEVTIITEDDDYLTFTETYLLLHSR